MSKDVDREVLGDWNNLKGTKYHITYAIWLILKDQAAEVRFFEGNDLWTAPGIPPIVKDSEAEQPVLAVARIAAEEIWIQLKCTRTPWTPSSLLDENLLFNFVCNTFESDRRRKVWQVRLVTEAEVRKDEIHVFASDSDGKPILKNKLEGIVRRVVEFLANRGDDLPSREAVTIRALDILRMLAETKPIMLDTLKAEVEVEIALVSPDRLQMKRLASLLVGAMLEDSGAGPVQARPYDASWVNEIAGFGLRSNKPFEVDVAQACDLAAATVAKQRIYPPFESHRHVRREGLAQALGRFVTSPETVFVLTGASGQGASWSLADWAAERLAGHIRVFLLGADVSSGATAKRIITDPVVRYSDSAGQDDHILERLIAAARVPGKGPLTVLLDDLLPDEMAARGETRILTSLVDILRPVGGKLILSCREQLWGLYRPWQYFPAGTLYDPEGLTTGQPTNRSYRLKELDPDELADAVRRGLNQTPDAPSLLLHRILLGPGYMPLRNPSLLNRYLRANALALSDGDTPPPPVNVDLLLADSVSDQLERSANSLMADNAAIRDAFTSLVDYLWLNRRSGVAHAKSVAVLEEFLPNEGHSALNSFRRSGLLSTESPLRIPDGHVANHLFAASLERQLEIDPRGIATLDPDRDGTTIESLIRNSPNYSNHSDSLLTQGERWRGPVARGLSQRTPGLRAFAMATTLSRPRGNFTADHDGCIALGTLAARDAEILKLVEKMYLGPDKGDALRGAEALGVALDYIPKRVCEVVADRWFCEANGSPDGDTRAKGTRLRDTLWPLTQVKHRTAAVAVRNAIDSLVDSLDLTAVPRADQLQEILDYIRGRLLRFEGNNALMSLLAEVESADTSIRFRAAETLRSFGLVKPEPILNPLLAAIQRERDPEVMGRLLRGMYTILELSPEDVIRTLEIRCTEILAQPASAAPAIAFLGHAAKFDAERVRRLLPVQLDHLEPWARAYLADVHAFAWWHISELLPEAVLVLKSLGRPDFVNTPEEFQTFSERGAAVARLGHLCLGMIEPRSTNVSSLQGATGSIPYYYTNTINLFLRHASKISEHPMSSEFTEQILRVVQSANASAESPNQDSLRSARLFAARNSLDEFVELAVRQVDPVEFIRDLPRDWEAIYVAKRLLQSGIKSKALATFAINACDEHKQGGSMSAIGERDLCLAEMAMAASDPSEAVATYFAERPPSLFGSAWTTQVHGIASFIDRHPDQILSHFDVAMNNVEAFVALFHWQGIARHWRAYLVAEVFSSMFDQSPLDSDEALRLAKQVLEAICDLPPSPLCDEYKQVYQAIVSWLSGTPVTLTISARSNSLIGQSHSAVVRLFESASINLTKRDGIEWLDDFLWQSDCWQQSRRYRIEAGRISSVIGDGAYLIVMLPALRLALVAVGVIFGQPDPGAQFMCKRRGDFKRAKEVNQIASNPSIPGLATHLRSLEGSSVSLERDEHILSTAGYLLLLLGKLDDAEDRLTRALASPLIDQATRAQSLYNLACVYARSNREQECREALEGALISCPGYKNAVQVDEDLASVRECGWFKAINS